MSRGSTRFNPGDHVYALKKKYRWVINLAKTSIRPAVFSSRRVVGPIALFIFPNTRARAVTLPSCLTPAGLERERVWGWERGRSDRRLEWRHGGLGALAGVLGCVRGAPAIS
jgi:hypothetical protein